MTNFIFRYNIHQNIEEKSTTSIAIGVTTSNTRKSHKSLVTKNSTDLVRKVAKLATLLRGCLPFSS